MNRHLVMAALGAAAFSLSSAQTAPQTLDTYVVSASGIPQDPAALPNDVVPLRLADLAAEQVPDLRSALAETPGVAVVNSGAIGSQSSIFIRGANSDQTLFIVDGVRLNTSADSYANYLGAADLAGLDRLEVLMGPQSTVYGSSAAGGVVLLETAHGAGAPSGMLAAEAGSFGTVEVQAASSGAVSTFDYSASAARETTDNDRFYNKFSDWTYSARAEDQLAPWLLAGGTVRGVDSHYEEPGATPTDFPDYGAITSDTNLATGYLEASAGTAFRSRLTAAWYQDEYTFDDGSPYDFYQERNTREVLESQNTWQALPALQIVAGLDAEWARYWAGSLSSDRLLAGYGLATWQPVSGVEITGGIRRDDYSVEGGATTGRAGISYRPGGGPTKLRATYGTGFEAPTPSDRYGEPPYVLPNPAVQPERSRGWDAGIDQRWDAARTTFSATVFGNRFDDLLEYEVVDPLTYAGEEINVDRASTSGFEFSAQSDPAPMFSTRLSYTYLNALDDVSGERLQRRPRHVLDAAAEFRPGAGLTLGAGLHLVADQYDGVETIGPFGGYTTVRLFARYQVRPSLALKVRVENLLNRDYEEAAGYPALPRAIYGGVEWRP